jgi:hypothetical protein
VSSGPEWEYVEQPLLAQLEALGWSALNWPDATAADNVERASQRAVLLEQRLRDRMPQSQNSVRCPPARSCLRRTVGPQSFY